MKLLLLTFLFLQQTEAQSEESCFSHSTYPEDFPEEAEKLGGYEYTILSDGTYLFIDSQFLCDGIITQVSLPAFFTTARARYWINTVSMKIDIFTRNGSSLDAIYELRGRFKVIVDLTEQAYRGGLVDYDNTEQRINSSTVLHLRKNLSIAVQSGDILRIILPPYDYFREREIMIPLIKRKVRFDGGNGVWSIFHNVPYIYFDVERNTEPSISSSPTSYSASVSSSLAPESTRIPQSFPVMSSETPPLAVAFVILFIVALLVIIAGLVILIILIMKGRVVFKLRKGSIYETATGYHTTTEEVNGAIAAQNPIYAAVDSPHGRYEMVTNHILTTDSTAPLDRDHQPAAEDNMQYSVLVRASHSGLVGGAPVEDDASYSALDGSKHYQNAHTSAIGEKGEMTEVTEDHDTYQMPSPMKDKYFPPAETENEIYGQLAEKKHLLIVKDMIKLLEKLGEGEFGEVYRGMFNSRKSQPMEVAVKVTKPDASLLDKIKFLQEATIMGQFNHRNVSKLFGIVTSSQPNMMVMEYLSSGDLRTHLTKVIVDDLTAKAFLSFSKDICAGMEYLSSKGFIHRDLAARNILLDKNLHCKIADFGMSRVLDGDPYYTSKGGCIPLCWTAPEAILYRRYSLKSDVWSFGMVLYEIWSLGEKPFGNMGVEEILSIFNSGYCQPPPAGCPRGIYSLMVDCWNPNHHARPDFMTLLKSHEDGSLLNWSSEDCKVRPQALELGGPLKFGTELFKDLQLKYM